MMVQHDISLRKFNTFGVDVRTKAFCEVESKEDLRELISSGILKEKYFILGGGANILFTKDFDGLIIKSAIKDIAVENEIVEAGSGVVWHDFLQFLLKNSLYGGENLAKIPGTVGAAPVQNIGAYGAEQKDIFESLDAIDLQTGEMRTFRSEECKFAYRYSIFKTPEFAGRYFITHVRYRLSREPVINSNYKDLQNRMQTDGVQNPTPEYIFSAISSIRDAKLPDPAEFGNAGSFFKNPVISPEHFAELVRIYSELPSYPAPNGMIKVPAAKLIELAGLKGARLGDAGISPKHALIVQNFGSATGKDLFEFSEHVIERVAEMFGITLEREVIVV